MKQLNPTSPRLRGASNEITKVLKYFSFFAYHPALDEIYTFLQAKISKNSLNMELERMVRRKQLSASKDTPPQYSIRQSKKSKYPSFAKASEGKQISKRKLKDWRFRLYLKLISLFPQIRLVGLSGSISMMNAGENDDIDLFIITAKNRLFTGRLITLVLAQLLGLRRNRDSATQIFQKTHKTEKFAFASSVEHKNKVCLNLFFDERKLKVPKYKQTVFVGHEVLQMKPIIVKGNIYERFLEANEWVFRLFPNGKSKYQILNIKSQINYKLFKFKILNLFGTWNLEFRISNKIESILKKIQLRLINKHKTTEIITSTQLWFHPDDFEKKMEIN